MNRAFSAAAPSRALRGHYAQVRARSLQLAQPLSAEDAMVQSMPDASPAKWHLAHTTWFFERFILAARPGYRSAHPQWDYLFNSYYQGVGPAHARAQRGLLSRPSLQQVLDYRHDIDTRMLALLEEDDLPAACQHHVQLGLQHEQQHQELLLTDIKHALWCNPLQPAYRDDLPRRPAVATPLGWQAQAERIVQIGAPRWPQDEVFAYDNESPPHRVLVPAHALADRPVSNAEFRQFIQAGGYQQPRWWMSEGWARCQAEQWQHPLYWNAALEQEFTLAGPQPLDPHAAVCHISYFEADAYARWAGARLPTEFEWETAAAGHDARHGNFADDDALHPGAEAGSGMRQLFGDVWEWTSSAYSPYPGFRTFDGDLGEYNGKFMCGQWILRGGSCATPRGHVRASYRNFFDPAARWQFSGLRLAKDMQ